LLVLWFHMCLRNIPMTILQFCNSAITVISGFAFSKVVFIILFHLDNRKKYTKRFTGKLNFPVLKQIVTKMIFADYLI
jgi:hypothetical protein